MVTASFCAAPCFPSISSKVDNAVRFELTIVDQAIWLRRSPTILSTCSSERDRGRTEQANLTLALCSKLLGTNADEYNTVIMSDSRAINTGRSWWCATLFSACRKSPLLCARCQVAGVHRIRLVADRAAHRQHPQPIDERPIPSRALSLRKISSELTRAG